MRVMTNGVMREVYALKHFKIGADEYVLYKNNENVSIGLIQENKIIAPDASKFDILMKVLSNLISPTPNADFNTQNGCVELDKNFVNTLEEVSFQNVNIPQEQLNNLMNSNSTTQASNIIESIPIDNTQTSPAPVAETKPEIPKNNRMKIYGIVIVILALVLGVLLFKDKIFKKGGSSSIPTPPPVVTPAPVANTTIDTCPNCVFAYYEELKKYSGDDKLPLDNYVSNYNQVVDGEGMARTFFFGHVLDGEGKIERAYVCAVLNSNPFCIEGTLDGSLYENNKQLLTNIFGMDKCSDTGTEFVCNDGLQAHTYSYGNVKVIVNNSECQVYNNGDMGCQSRSS